MDKTKFVFRLQEMFSSLRDRTFESVNEEYNVVLTEDIDYQRLFNIFCSEWDSKSRPLPAELKGFIARAKKQNVASLDDTTQRILLHAAMYYSSDEWSFKHRQMPSRLKFLVEKFKISDTLINEAIISGTVDRFDWDKKARRLYA